MVQLIDFTRENAQVNVTTTRALQSQINAEYNAQKFAGFDYTELLDAQDVAADEIIVDETIINGDDYLTRLGNLYVELAVA